MIALQQKKVIYGGTESGVHHRAIRTSHNTYPRAKGEYKWKIT